MNTRTTIQTLTIAAAGVALTAALTGCDTSANAQPTTTIATCTDCTSAPTATTTTPGAAAKEKADQAAAEAVWRKFISVAYTIDSMSAEEAASAAKTVAVEPTESLLVKKRESDASQGLGTYGVPVSYITWPSPIGGADTAVLSDCQDGSQAGTKDAKSGNKVGVGTVDTPFRGTLKRTPDGWRVASAELLKGATCAAHG